MKPVKHECHRILGQTSVSVNTIMKFVCFETVPFMSDVCPYEVAANWTCLDPSDLTSTTILTKDGKTIGLKTSSDFGISLIVNSMGDITIFRQRFN